MLRNHMRRFGLVLLVGCALVLHAEAAHADYVWWEGEDAYEHNFSNAPFAAATLDNPEALSGGRWLNTGGAVPPGGTFARWRVEVPGDGRYYLYARKFWHHGPFRRRFDQAEWQTVDRTALLVSVELRTFIVANWVSLGPVTLAGGEHVLEVRLLAEPGPDGPAAAFDCFALTSEAWTPRGTLRPDEKSGKAAPGWWAFEPDVDGFGESPIDLRYLNHDIAGEMGFLTADGLDFRFEREEAPTRFWAVNAGATVVNLDRDSVDYLARFLAKHGVNMIRVHSALFDRAAPDPATVDQRCLANLHYFVYAMKQQGIYTYLSIYFPLWFDAKPNYGLPGFEGIENKKPFALLFFHARMQEIYRSWARGLLTSVNPHTGLSFADAPAVAIYEIINEDNYFFWTFTPGTNIPWECMPPLEKRFGDWAARRHGSVEAALAAWDYPNDRDSAAEGRLGLLSARAMTTRGMAAMPGARQRVGDQVQFLTEDLRGFYERMRAWLRGDLGVKCPTVATNWTTADSNILGALDRYTNMACEVIDRHGYWSPPQQKARSYTVTEGDRYQNACGLTVPEQLNVRELQYDGHPHTVSEYLFTPINLYTTDSVFMAAAYGALQGTDGFYWFAIAGPIELGNVTLRSGNDYGSLMVVSLDGAPLDSSRKVLIQAATVEQNYGWTEEAQGEWLKVTNLGTPPINVRDIAGEVAFARADADELTVAALDANGYPTERSVSTSAADGKLTVTLLPDCLYYVVEIR